MRLSNWARRRLTSSRPATPSAKSKRSQRFARLSLACLVTSSTLGCALIKPAAQPPRNDACAWIRAIVPDEGFQDRWTRDEKEQVLALILAIERNCANSV